jgi:hypothetical protein
LKQDLTIHSNFNEFYFLNANNAGNNFVKLKCSPVDNYELKYALDSIVEFEVGEDTTQLTANQKEEYFYNEYGQTTTIIRYIKGRGTTRLRKSNKDECEFNDDNMLIQDLGYIWDVDNQEWDLYSKGTYTYNENNFVLEYVYCKWNEQTQEWENNYKQNNIYDEINRIILTLASMFDEETNDWKLNYKTEYTYDGDNSEPSLMITYLINNETGELEYKRKTENIFDETGVETESYYYLWDSETQEWKTDQKTEYFYNENDLLYEYITYNWDEGKGWEPDSKSNYVFNANNELIKFMYSMWVNQMWTVMMINEAAFNNDIMFAQLLLPFYYSDESCSYNWFHHMLLQMLFYYMYTELELGYIMQYYYSETEIMGGMQEKMDENLSIFPNPFKDKVTFDVSDKSQKLTIEIFDMQGRKVISRIINNGNNLNLSDLASGMYIYNINGYYHGKIIKY